MRKIDSALNIITSHLIFATITLALVFVGCAARTTFSAETRGLRVIAKDPITNQTGEVKLYNKSYAVIIGIDRYPNLPQDRQLSYAVKDAKGVEQVIKRQYKFDKVFTLYDQQATKKNILELLTEELPGQMGEDDALFIFWAGHGNQEKKSDGDLGYLVPSDGTINKLTTVITMDEIKNTVSKAIPAKHVFYVFDACYSGLLTTRSVDNKSRRDLAYLREITRERVRQVLTAGSKGQEVLDSGRNGHSVFTGRLIEILEAKGDFVTANEIQAIIREKVSGDARARGYNQTPAFDAISGSGDFVFVPNIELKVQDTEAELVKLMAEKRSLEETEKMAIRQHDEKKRKDAERQKKVIEGKLKAEELKKQQLADEQKRRELEAQDRSSFDIKRKEDEQRLVLLKAEVERKRQMTKKGDTSTLEAAIAEIKRVNAQINELENNFAPFRKQINSRYDHLLSLLDNQKRDEFERKSDFQARIQKEKDELDGKRRDELAKLESRIVSESASLKTELKRLSEKEYMLDPATLTVDLGPYDVDNRRFTVAIKNMITVPPAPAAVKGKKSKNNVSALSVAAPLVKVAMNGTIMLPSQEARIFKQQYASGLLRPEVTVMPGGYLVKVALFNDAENYVMPYEKGTFVTPVERERKKKEHLIYTDSSSGLMWVRSGKVAGEEMNWETAIKWVKRLNYGGYSDWRLPTKEELEAFAKQGGVRPPVWFNSNGFSSIHSSKYWSSSLYANGNDYAMTVNMNGVAYVDYGHKGYNHYVWPVRDIK